MAYRNFNSRHRGRGEGSDNGVWPWHDPPHPHPPPAPNLGSFREPFDQHRPFASGRWPWTAPPSTTASSTYRNTQPGVTTWKQRREAETEEAIREEPSAAPTTEATRFSSSWNTPPQHRQTAPPINWSPNRGAVRGDSVQEAAAASPGTEAFPIDLALKELHEALAICKTLCEGYTHAFQRHDGIAFAERDTLAKLWLDLMRWRDNASKFRAATDRIRSCLSRLKTALKDSETELARPQVSVRSNSLKHNNSAEENPEVIKRRALAARKAAYHGEEVLLLASGARSESWACTLLAEELNGLMAMLDPKRHPLLYNNLGDEKNAQQARGKGPAPTNQTQWTSQSTQRSQVPPSTPPVKPRSPGERKVASVMQTTKEVQEENGTHMMQGRAGVQREQAVQTGGSSQWGQGVQKGPDVKAGEGTQHGEEAHREEGSQRGDESGQDHSSDAQEGWDPPPADQQAVSSGNGNNEQMKSGTSSW